MSKVLEELNHETCTMAILSSINETLSSTFLFVYTIFLLRTHESSSLKVKMRQLNIFFISHLYSKLNKEINRLRI